MTVYQLILDKVSKGEKGIVLLIDPDKGSDKNKLRELLVSAKESGISFIFVGGSLITEDGFDECLQFINSETDIPLILFPGSPMQVNRNVDAVLFLSVISGRNPELLIGHHVMAAPKIKEYDLETIATGYMLVDSGRATTAQYMSQTFPIPWNKPEIAACTALAGQMLGLQCIYLDAGSGAQKPVSLPMINAVKQAIDIPLIVGGGLRSSAEIHLAFESGADLVVIGTVLEEEPELIAELIS